MITISVTEAVVSIYISRIVHTISALEVGFGTFNHLYFPTFLLKIVFVTFRGFYTLYQSKIYQMSTEINSVIIAGVDLQICRS
jgi:hypothetical protein